MDHQGLTSARILTHPSVSPRERTAPRVYRLIVEVTPDADVTRGLKTIRNASRFGLHLIEARPYDGQTRQLTRAAVKRRERQRKLSPDEDDDIFRRRSHDGFSF